MRSLAIIGGLICSLLSAQVPHTLRTGRELGLLGAGVVLHGAAAVQAMGTHAGPLPDRALVPPIDRVALDRWDVHAHRASNVLVAATAAGALTSGVLVQRGERPLVPAVITLETVLLTSGLTNIVKEWVARPRPYAYGDQAPEHLRSSDEARLSFWSGHTANTAALAFSTAAMIDRSDASPEARALAWVGAGVLPATVGLLRVKAGRHFPTDVLVGCAVGAAIGLLVPALHDPQWVRP